MLAGEVVLYGSIQLWSHIINDVIDAIIVKLVQVLGWSKM
jgi:hypothetical protein